VKTGRPIPSAPLFVGDTAPSVEHAALSSTGKAAPMLHRQLAPDDPDTIGPIR